MSKNIEINQEFSFTASKTRLEVNSIYNLSWYGSTLWNLFGSEAIKIESSYNRSIKYTMGLPYAIHRYLVEPVSERRHLKWLLLSKFLAFMQKIDKSKKPILKMLKETTERDVMSPTGSNMRNIMLILKKTDIEEVTKSDVDRVKYFPISIDVEWKVELIDIILEEQEGRGEDSSGWLKFLCTD